MVNRLFPPTMARGRVALAFVALAVLTALTPLTTACTRDPVAEAAARRAADPVVGIWRGRLRPEYQGKLDPDFMPIYIFKASGDAVAINLKLVTEDPGVWRRDADGRLWLKLDSEPGERRIGEQGEQLDVAEPPGAVFPGPGLAVWRVAAAEQAALLGQIDAMEQRAFGGPASAAAVGAPGTNAPPATGQRP